MSEVLTPARHPEAELRHVMSLERPHPSLFTYYLLQSLMLGPLFFIPLIPLSFRYHTLHYRFDAQGVQMRWGILFRREVSLAYARIQDIHLTSNFIERWLGLARIQISTASGQSSAEMTIEGLKEYELVRDFLYTRMRGVHDVAGGTPATAATPAGAGHDAIVAALDQVSADLRAVRAAIEAREGERRA